MVRPKISVIVPVYNVEKYIDECIESLIGQTISEIEIILVDDGSPDSSGRICDEYAKKDNRIKVIHKTNEGLGYARNSGIAIATGEFISFVDSDDFVDIDRYEELYEIATQEKADVCLGAISVYKDGKVIRGYNCHGGMVYAGDEIQKKVLPTLVGKNICNSDYVGMSACLGIYNTELIKKYSVLFKSEREFVSEDLIFDLELYKYVNKVVMVDSAKYYYRVNTNSLTHTVDDGKFDKYDKMYFTSRNLVCGLESEDEIILRLRILLVFNYKAVLENYIYKEGFWKGLTVCKSMVKKELLDGIIKEIPIGRMQVKQRVLFYAIRHKMSFFICLLIIINSKK